MVTSNDFINELPFPLNVYACLLKQESGVVNYLHYGLFESPDMPVTAAQERSTELIWEKLPSPCKLLEVGIGLGTTLARLAEAGFEVTGITPDQTQVDYVRSRYHNRHTVQCSDFESFSQAPGSWDMLLFQESSQYINPIDLFRQATRLLAEKGEIIIVDEFSLKQDRPGRENLHYLKHFIELAERCGFSLIDRIDLSSEAAPSLGWLLHATQRQRASLRTELGLSEASLDELDESNRRYQKNYADGYYGYFLLKLKLSDPKSYQIGRITAANSDEMRSLFSRVFGHEMSEDFWHWKYGAGRGDAIGLWQNDRLVAHYGGIRRSLCHDGTVDTASQSCDVMVDPQVRARLSRKGPFFLLCATYIEQYLGYGNACLLAYGFPNERAYRLPYKLGLYTEPVTRVNELSWPTAALRKSRLWGMSPMAIEDPAQSAVIDAIWQTMRQELKDCVLGIRDADFWAHRYEHHPQHVYHCLLVYHRFSRKPLAVLALKQEGERVELLDWVASTRHLPTVIAAGQVFAGQRGASSLYLWASEPVAEYLAATQPTHHTLDICVPTNAWTSAPDPSVLQDRLWLTGGDTDFH